MPVDLKLARERWKQAEDAESKQRAREIEDLRFYAGEQWDKDILRARQGITLGSGVNQQVVPARPTIVVNKCLEPVRQILNQERQSDLTVELIPADDFGEASGPIDHTEIELREGLVRRIQRDSEAADARTWAFNRAAIAGRGYWAVNTRYVPGKSNDQEIYIERIFNQASVLLDPAHEQPDGSDAEWGFIGSDVPIAVYKAKYPNKKTKPNKVSAANSDDEWRALGDQAPNWFSGTGDTRSVRVVRYYYTEHEPRELVQLTDGHVAWRDELSEDLPDDRIESSRYVDQKQLYWADIDGVQELDGDEWSGHYVPIVKDLGEELQPYDNERRSQGIVRPMRGPCEGNNYIISKFIEQVGLTPIPPWMGPVGFDEGLEAEYDAANTRALSRLHYNSKDLNGLPIPPGAVMRTPVSTDVQHLAFGVNVFSQAIVSTSVMPETAFGQTDPTVKSGKMAQTLIAQAQQGTSNFMDNLKRSMRHEARIVNDLLYPIYGQRPGRLARMMNPQGEMAAVLIGQPFTVQGQGPQAKPQPVPQGHPKPEGAKEYTLTPDAEFNVAVKISKNEGTRREQEVQTLAELIGADPTLMQVLGDLFFKYQDGPGHQEMSERMKAVLIPPVQAMVSGKPQIPPEVQAQMAQMQEQMQQMSELADKNKTSLMEAQMKVQADVQTKQLQEQAETQRTAAKLEADERAQALDNLVKLAIAEIQSQDRQAAVHAEMARTELGFEHSHASESAQREHDTHEAAASRQHEAGQAERDRDIQTTEAERARQFEASQPEPV